MKRLTLVACLGLLALLSARRACADVAPPLQPPGSNIAPGGQTQVQMLAEKVVLEVAPPDGVRVSADFTMRNLGAAAEQMQVRFPLENPEGWGDGYGRYPQVRGFAAAVDGTPVMTRTIVEPSTPGERSIQWAAFDVAFPVGREVRIGVAYVTRLTGERDPASTGYDDASLLYILETGAGWRGAIGTADLILRLPYVATPGNLFLDQGSTPGGRCAGNEVRWHWESLEPTRQDNWRARLVWPEDWQRILTLEESVQARPDDIAVTVELAEAYRRVGGGSKGFVESEHLAKLSQDVVEQALARRPDSAELHAELAVVRWWRFLYCCYPPNAGSPAEPAVQAVRQGLETALRLDPRNERAAALSREVQAWLAQFPTPGPSPTKPRATTTPAPLPTATPGDRAAASRGCAPAPALGLTLALAVTSVGWHRRNQR